MPSFPVLKHYVTLGGDAPWQLHYRSQGANHLPVIVLLHASPMSSANMLPIMNALSDSFKVIALDTPGYGQSDPLPQYKDTQLQAEKGAGNMLNNKKLYDAYMKIDDLADFFGSLPPELSQLRNKMDEKYLKKGLAKIYSNWQDLWNEL